MENKEIYISLPLLKSKILTEKDEKSAIFKRFFRAESVFLTENEPILIDIWHHKSHANKTNKEEKLSLFESEIFILNTENPAILIGKEQNDFWLTNTAVDKSFFKNLKILPLLESNQKKNIYIKALKIFRKHYQTHWQNQIKLLKKSFDSFFNISEWENLKIKENLAFILKEWVLWIETEENYVTIQKNIIAPTNEVEKLFDKFKRKFEETKRKFEKLKTSDCKEEESEQLLEQYFEVTQKNLSFLENFWESQEKIYEVEIKQEDIFYYTIAVLLEKSKQENIISFTDFYQNVEIELFPNFFEYVEKGQNLFKIFTDYQSIDITNSIKEKNIDVENHSPKKIIKFVENEKKIMVYDQIILDNIPESFWTYKIRNKTFAEKIQKEKGEINEIIEKIKKYVGFLEAIK
ncbi:MAG: hypothetical protein EAZ85_10120 [Bacteroidetes bacterium]|nr:MAG: hypothetical protein EAZ85_10120 [Bacteroidota bacterium]TAG93015.1 MAG: hypothetical protein EAZ20_02035 [Bacteroidota bacterium]